MTTDEYSGAIRGMLAVRGIVHDLHVYTFTQFPQTNFRFSITKRGIYQTLQKCQDAFGRLHGFEEAMRNASRVAPFSTKITQTKIDAIIEQKTIAWKEFDVLFALLQKQPDADLTNWWETDPTVRAHFLRIAAASKFIIYTVNEWDNTFHFYTKLQMHVKDRRA